jgi:hypothetical protein
LGPANLAVNRIESGVLARRAFATRRRSTLRSHRLALFNNFPIVVHRPEAHCAAGHPWIVLRGRCPQKILYKPRMTRITRIARMTNDRGCSSVLYVREGARTGLNGTFDHHPIMARLDQSGGMQIAQLACLDHHFFGLVKNLGVYQLFDSGIAGHRENRPFGACPKRGSCWRATEFDSKGGFWAIRRPISNEMEGRKRTAPPPQCQRIHARESPELVAIPGRCRGKTVSAAGASRVATLE